MNNLTNDVVAITGASSGIGRQVAIEAAKRGARVVLMARSVDKLNEVKDFCDQINPDSATVYPLDVGNTDEIDEVVEKIYEEFGRIDYLLNAAGFGKFDSEFVNADFDSIQEMFIVNVLGSMYMTRVVATRMIDQSYGHILNIGSMAGKIPTAKSAGYSATKAAVIAFSDSLRLELRPFNIKVTTINPGPVNTEFFNIADPEGNYISNLRKLPISGMIFLEPEDLATEIVDTFGQNKRELNRPRVMAVASVLYKVMPRVGDYLNSRMGSLK